MSAPTRAEPSPLTPPTPWRPRDAAWWRALLAPREGAWLAGWLAARRWSGARTGVDDARVAAVIPLPFDVPAAWLTVDARVRDAGPDATPVRYQLPVSLAPADGVDGDASLGLVTERGTTLALVDATHDARFRDALHAALAAGAELAGEGARLVLEPVQPAAPAAAAPTASRVGSAEQSNTSIVYGDAAILKLFRRVARGAHPDVEITRFLTRAGFAHTPPLLAALGLEDERGASVAGMMQRFLPGSRDAWAHALDVGRRDLAGADGPRRGAFTADARALGAVTRALHDALASDPHDPAFAPERATDADVARWGAAARRSVDDGLALLAERVAAGALHGAVADQAGALAARAGEVRAAVDALAAGAAADAGSRVRHHGDYHLGQVLRTPDGAWWIIDFEGEPTRPLAERRERHSPLRDVAGMLRSFAYAAATLAAGDDPAREAFGDPDRLTARRAAGAAWEEGARLGFLEGYAAAGPAPYLPQSAGGRTTLTALFEIEKLFYELAYELRNRPDWLWIPLAGIARWRPDA